MAQVIRAAQASVLVIDPNDPDVLGQIEFVLGKLQSWRLPDPKLLAGNKIDRPNSEENFSAVAALYGDRLRSVALSAATGLGLDGFARDVFAALDVVRFYSKPPGKKADLDAPYVVRRGATVHEAAAHVHRDFAEHLKYARLFRIADEHSGLMVERAHLVEDRDVLEFHTA